jgi:hypothetical protein
VLMPPVYEFPGRIGSDYAAVCSNIELRGVASKRTTRGELMNLTLVSDACCAENILIASESCGRAAGLEAESYV